MSRAAIYSRVSSQVQSEEGTSLETQEAANSHYAHQRNYRRVAPEHVYCEVHTGAELWERRELARLRGAMRQREIDAVICYAVDRLSRSQACLAILVDEADHLGIRFEFVTEDFERSVIGEFIRSVKAFTVEVEREKIIERTERCRRARVANGQMLLGNRPPYGYQWADQRKTAVVEDLEKGATVHRIFREIAGGTTARNVALRLTREGVPTPKGQRIWSVPTITQILRPGLCR